MSTPSRFQNFSMRRFDNKSLSILAKMTFASGCLLCLTPTLPLNGGAGSPKERAFSKDLK